jgi:hypothetical protein
MKARFFLTKLKNIRDNINAFFSNVEVGVGPLMMSPRPYKEVILKPEFDCPTCNRTHIYGHSKDWIRCYGCMNEFSPWALDVIDLVPATQQEVDSFNTKYRAIEAHLETTQPYVRLSLGMSDFSIRMHHALKKRPVYIYKDYIRTLNLAAIDTLCKATWAKEA